ncbi:hypothetical protein FO519_004878 [Halicephalobus sp. NKZ332]|nr:hypothetical protein FO519_004878 [Halicephalobus sp. NKZ332]
MTRVAIEEARKREKLAKIEEDYLGKKIPVPTAPGDAPKFVLCPDIGYTQLMNLKQGRYSFNGANPEIENLMKEEEVRRRKKFDPDYSSDNDKEIKDEELAESAFGKQFGAPPPAILEIYTEESPRKRIDDSEKSNELEEGEIPDDDGRKKPRVAPFSRSRGGGKIRRRR